jgi:hypothetical protein
VRRQLELRPGAERAWAVLLAAGVMAAAIWPLRERTPALTVPLGALVYAGALWAFGGSTGARWRRCADEDLGARRVRRAGRRAHGRPGDPGVRARARARRHLRRDAGGARAERGGRPRMRLLEAGMADVEALVAAAREHDVVVAQELPPVAWERLAGGPARLVADLYNPIVIEVLAGVAARAPAARRAIHGRIVRPHPRALRHRRPGDLRQRAPARPVGSAAWRCTVLIGVDDYARDPTLRSRVEVVPFGLPRRRRRPLAARCGPRSRRSARTIAC